MEGMHMNQLKWDIYFLRIAKEVSKNAKCLSRQIGAVLVRDKTIISTGYNGPARGMKHCNERFLGFYNYLDGTASLEHAENNKTVIKKCPRKELNYQSGKGLHLCQAGHGERNALIQAGRMGVATKDATLYCYCGQVCKDCAIEIINAGIKRLVFLTGKIYDNYSGVLLKESGIEITRIEEELI